MTLCVSCRSFLGIGLNNFESLDIFEKAPFVLGNELWEDDFSSMLDLVKDYIVDVWELQKARLTKISAFHSPSVRVHLGNWGMLGAVVGLSVCMVR